MSTRGKTPTLNEDGVSVKGCTMIYAPKGQAGEYAPLAANPYRGCGHKCRYCLDGDTVVQMADGRGVRIRDIQVGDRIIGVTIEKKRSWGTRLAITTVSAKMATRKKAMRVSLEDGTTVVCSADHRWLTDRGWKHTDSDGKSLTLNNSIRRCGASQATPPESRQYQRGYLAGMIEGDGNLKSYDYRHMFKKGGKKRRQIDWVFRLALKDFDALGRARRYLENFGIETTEKPFACDTCEMRQIHTRSVNKWKAIKKLLRPMSSLEWKRGFVAGIFDAEGSHGRESLRIANTDERLLTMIIDGLDAFGFSWVREVGDADRAVAIRVVGGRQETTRFWQLFSPAISRKFILDGKAVACKSRVVEVVDLKEERVMFDITTGTETFLANGMVSHNCYVPGVLRMKREEFDKGAVPRPDFARKVATDADKYASLGITAQVMLSFTTDPYHPGDTTLTRETLNIISSRGLGICTLTKGGTRSLRDLDLFSPDTDAFASTLTSLDPAFSRKWEASAALPVDRIAALRRFHGEGIFTWVSLEPTLSAEASLEIVEATHEFVDLYKVGKANYITLPDPIDWEAYTHRMIETLGRLGAAHYIKEDLQPYLPPGFNNPKRVKQHHGAAA